MNIDSLNIEFDSSEGAVRRLLGVIEARGFQVRAMSMGTDIERSRMTVGLTPRDPGRCLDILSRQIARIQGVRHVAPMRAAPTVVREAAHVAQG
jgi:acetolactate synthase II small subunit